MYHHPHGGDNTNMDEQQPRKEPVILFTETIKADMLRQLQRHYAADEITQGHYWKHGKGCAVGCLTHDPKGGHNRFPVMFGLPEQFARLIDSIFEGLPSDVAKGWPLRVIEAVPVGAILDQAFFDDLALARLHRVLALQNSWPAEDRELVVPAIEGMILALKTGQGFEEAQSTALGASRCALRSSAEYAARSAAWSAARFDAWSIATAARSAATSAAWYAAGDADRDAAATAALSGSLSLSASAAWLVPAVEAKESAWEQEADTLINHLQNLETDPA